MIKQKKQNSKQGNKLQTSYKLESLPEILKSVKSLMREVEKAKLFKPNNFDDTYAIYLLKFASRFQEHAFSIIKLSESKDSWLIGRSMLEGLIIINWISDDPEKRQKNAKRYAQLSLIEEYTHKHKDKEIGLDPLKSIASFTYGKVKDSILANINDFKLTEIEKRNIIEDKPLQHIKFIKRLTGNDIRKNFELYLPLKDPPRPGYYHTLFYNYFSEYHHWNSRTLFSLGMLDGTVKLLHGTEQTYAFALEVVFLSLHRVLLLLHEYFDLKLSIKLDSLMKDYLIWYKTIPIPSL